MNTSSDRTLPPWIVSTGTRPTKQSPVRDDTVGTLREIKLHNSRAYRSRILIGVLLSLVLHGVFLAAFRGRPEAIKQAETTPRLALESFVIPAPEEAAEQPTETTDTSNVAQSYDFAPPSLPEQVSIPVSTDFVITPAPAIPISSQVDRNLIKIPQNLGYEQVLKKKQVFSVAELDRQPEIVHAQNPAYPPDLLGSNIQGVVVVHFIITSQGGVVQPEIVSAPHPSLGVAVARALDKWRFKAGVKSGRAVATSMELPVRFSLDKTN